MIKLSRIINKFPLDEIKSITGDNNIFIIKQDPNYNNYYDLINFPEFRKGLIIHSWEDKNYGLRFQITLRVDIRHKIGKEFVRNFEEFLNDKNFKYTKQGTRDYYFSPEYFRII